MIDIKSISKWYGSFQVLKDCTTQVAKGEVVVVCGESTSGCVRATVVDAKSHRFKVLIPEPCVFDRDEASHAINLYDMDQKYADVLSIQETLEQLGRVPGRGAQS